jgi:NADPH-dependent methylglyoxal reductase
LLLITVSSTLTLSLSPYAFVNVSDVAKAHVAALTSPSAAGKRYLVSAGPFNNTEVGHLMAKAVPGQAHRIPHTDGAPFATAFKIDSAPSVQDLGIKCGCRHLGLNEWSAC